MIRKKIKEKVEEYGGELRSGLVDMILKLETARFYYGHFKNKILEYKTKIEEYRQLVEKNLEQSIRAFRENQYANLEKLFEGRDILYRKIEQAFGGYHLMFKAGREIERMFYASLRIEEAAAVHRR